MYHYYCYYIPICIWNIWIWSYARLMGLGYSEGNIFPMRNFWFRKKIYDSFPWHHSIPGPWAAHLAFLAHSVKSLKHYDDAPISAMASQITSLTIVYSIVCSGTGQRKHQSSVSLAFVRGIHRDRWIPRTKRQFSGKCFHLMTSSWNDIYLAICLYINAFWLFLDQAYSNCQPHIMVSKLVKIEQVPFTDAARVFEVMDCSGWLSCLKWNKKNSYTI